MARILFSTLPVRGHTNPAAAAAQRLMALGHDVLFALPTAAVAFIPEGLPTRETTSDTFTYEPTSIRLSPLAVDDIKAIAENMRYVLWAWTSCQLPRLREIAEAYTPDLIVSDCLHLAPLIVARERHVPSISLGVTPYRNTISGSAPVRSGWAPASNLVQRWAFDLINRGIERVFLGVRDEVTRGLQELSPGLREFWHDRQVSVFGICEELATLYVQCSSQRLEDRPNTLDKRGIEFIGSLNQQRVGSASRNAVSGHVVMTWGTMQRNPPPVFVEVVKRLSRSIDRTIYLAPPEAHRTEVERLLRVDVALRRVVIIEDFQLVLDRAALFVSNGGFGAVKEALSRGIPVVCFGDQDDKPDVCGRVRRSGVGIGASWFLRPGRIVKHIRRVLTEPSFSERATTVRDELAALDSAQVLEQTVERLLASRSSATQS